MRDLIGHIRGHVAELCSERCAGREAGSIEGLEARRYIIAELAAAGLDPRIQKVPGCRGANVIARINPADSGPVILIGAHYDHLGRAWEGEAYWGADDNAAAVSILLELAHSLGDLRGADLALVAFDGEEPPHFLTHEMGSQQFVADPPFALERIELAVVMDLVGHAVGPEGAPATVRNTLFALGAEKSTGTAELVDRAASDPAIGDALRARRLDLDVVPPLSDYEPLRRAGVPVLFLTGGRWRHYHQVTDTPDRLDYPKIAATARFLERLCRLRAASPEPAGRYRPDEPDHASTVHTLLELARELEPHFEPAALAAAALEPIGDRIGSDARLPPAQWAQVLQILALMEQGLA